MPSHEPAYGLSGRHSDGSESLVEAKKWNAIHTGTTMVEPSFTLVPRYWTRTIAIMSHGADWNHRGFTELER